MPCRGCRGPTSRGSWTPQAPLRLRGAGCGGAAFASKGLRGRGGSPRPGRRGGGGGCVSCGGRPRARRATAVAVSNAAAGRRCGTAPRRSTNRLEAGTAGGQDARRCVGAAATAVRGDLIGAPRRAGPRARRTPLVQGRSKPALRSPSSQIRHRRDMFLAALVNGLQSARELRGLAGSPPALRSPQSPVGGCGMSDPVAGRHVVVVGGGIAGLAAAAFLRAEGGPDLHG